MAGPQPITVVALSGSTFGTAAWKTKSVMSSSVLLEACIVITVTLGLVFDLSKVKSIFSPFLLYAVIEGIPVENKSSRPTESGDHSQHKTYLPQTRTLLKIKYTPPSPPAPMCVPHFTPQSPPFLLPLVSSSSWVLWHLRLRIYMSLTCSNIIEERL